jgi:hypothetical protein
MNTLRTGFLALIAGGLLLGGSAIGGSDAFAASGPQPNGSANIGAAACQPGAGAWTDCAIQLRQSVPAGSEIAATVPSADGAVAYCEQSASADGDGDNTVAPAGTLCGLSGNSAVFTCVDGCPSGTALSFSLLNGSAMPSDGALAQQITVTSGSAPSQTALPATLGS